VRETPIILMIYAL